MIRRFIYNNNNLKNLLEEIWFIPLILFRVLKKMPLLYINPLLAIFYFPHFVSYNLLILIPIIDQSNFFDFLFSGLVEI